MRRFCSSLKLFNLPAFSYLEILASKKLSKLFSTCSFRMRWILINDCRLVANYDTHTILTDLKRGFVWCSGIPYLMKYQWNVRLLFKNHDISYGRMHSKFVVHRKKFYSSCLIIVHFYCYWVHSGCGWEL